MELQVTVKYFGAPLANLGPKAKGFELPLHTTLAQLLQQIGQGMEEMDKKMLSLTTCMVNGSHVGKHHLLQDGDEVYILYPVSGG